MAEAKVVDVTLAAQLATVGEQPAPFHEGLDLGLEFAGKRVAQLTLDLSACRTKLAKALTDAESCERLTQHWKAEAQMWQAECERIGAEYTAFVKEMARRLGK